MTTIALVCDINGLGIMRNKDCHFNIFNYWHRHITTTIGSIPHKQLRYKVILKHSYGTFTMISPLTALVCDLIADRGIAYAQVGVVFAVGVEAKTWNRSRSVTTWGQSTETRGICFPLLSRNYGGAWFRAHRKGYQYSIIIKWAVYSGNKTQAAKIRLTGRSKER